MFIFNDACLLSALRHDCATELESAEDLYQRRVTRILTTDFPVYFALVTRIRQESKVVGPDGGIISSTVVPQVQVVFPQGAITKSIRIGLQVGASLNVARFLIHDDRTMLDLFYSQNISYQVAVLLCQ